MKTREINISYTEYESMDQLSCADRELAEAAIKAMSGAYTPYSHFNVGAAVRLSTGEIVTGANQENIAFPSGLCAERTAMFHASATHPDAAMVEIAITASQNGMCFTCNTLRSLPSGHGRISGKIRQPDVNPACRR